MQPRPRSANGIAMVGFDADDTLWKSEDYYRAAQGEFERIVAGYVDLADVAGRLYAVEKRNLALFGYGAKGMTLSMLEAAVEITGSRVSAADLHRIVGLGKHLLQHPVDVLDGVRAAVEAVAARYPVVLITKGDLFHQEPQAYPCRVRASHRKSLKNISSVSSHCRRSRRACGPVRPVVAYSCPGFAPIMEAA